MSQRTQAELQDLIKNFFMEPTSRNAVPFFNLTLEALKAKQKEFPNPFVNYAQKYLDALGGVTEELASKVGDGLAEFPPGAPEIIVGLGVVLFKVAPTAEIMLTALKQASGNSQNAIFTVLSIINDSFSLADEIERFF